MAAIDFTVDPDKELYDRFYEVCQTLSYSDIRRLAKGLDVAESTIRFWKTTKTFPVTRSTARRVIQWVEEGKPLKFRTQAQIATNSY